MHSLIYTVYFSSTVRTSISSQRKLLYFVCWYNIEIKFCILMHVPRADTESTSEHLEALMKLSSDLEEQRSTLEDLRDQKHAILPRLSLLDKELVKQQVAQFFFIIYLLQIFIVCHQFHTALLLILGGTSGATLVSTSVPDTRENP